MSVLRKTIQLGRFVNPLRLSSCKDAFIRRVSGISSPSSVPGILSSFARNYSETVDVPANERMEQILKKKFPKAKKIVVNDISGGCGSMFEIFVETIEFKGLSLVKQHMLINQTLRDQIKSMHGLTVKTKVADAS